MREEVGGGDVAQLEYCYMYHAVMTLASTHSVFF